MTDIERLNEVYPGSDGGVIEAVKRSVVNAMRKALTGTGLTSPDEGIHVDLEYPLEEEEYPGVWVQFSLSDIKPSGLGHAVRRGEDVIQQWQYEGRVSLFIVALTSIERDRISDRVINTLSVARSGLDDKFSDFYKALDDNPYVSMTVNSDAVRPMGQSITVGVPWDPSQLAYEDSYGFDVLGQFQYVTDASGVTRLRRIDIEHEVFIDRRLESGQWF